MVPFKSVTIVASSGGKLFLVPLQSVFFCRIWREFVLVPFQSASIDSASWREVSFWFLLSQRGKLFLVPLQSASLFSVPFQSASIVAAFGGKFFLLFHIYP